MSTRSVVANTARFVARRGSRLAGRIIVTVDPALRSSLRVELGPNRVMLVAGLDRNVGGWPVVGRADSILLVIVVADQPVVHVVAIPRDVAVDLAVGMQRLGWAIEYGGLRSLVDAVTRLTGLRIDHVVAVDVATLAGAVDALGGIDVEVPSDARDRRTGVDLVAGSQRLSGADAVAYVRSRLDESDAPGVAPLVLGDEGRRGRLQIVAHGLRRRWASAGSWRRLQTVWTLRGRLLVDRAFPNEAMALAGLVSACSLQFTDLATRPLVPDEARRSPFPPHHVTGSRYVALTDDAMEVLHRLTAPVR